MMTKIKGAAFAIGLAILLIISSPPRAVNAQTIQSCGNEGEAPCPFAPTSFNGPCDNGLAVTVQTCGCLLRGFFGNCLIPRLCTTCENFTRRQADVGAFGGSWNDWALRNQRDLAQDEPINWVMQLGTHNSFNSGADGHVINFPNHYYSMTDQLRSGARFLAIDAHFIPVFDGPARLCHGGDKAFPDIGLDAPGALCVLPGASLFPPGMRFFANGIKEIKNWLAGNPSEIVIVAIEDYVGTDEEGGVPGDLTSPINASFGGLVVRQPLEPPAGRTQTRWPTRREMLAAGRRVIVADDSGIANPLWFHQGTITAGSVADWKARDMRRYPSCVASSTVSAVADSDRFSGATFDSGDRIRLASVPGQTLPAGVSDNVSYYVLKFGNAFAVAETPGGPAVDITTDGEAIVTLLTRSNRFSIVAEDRSGLSLVFPEADIGELGAADVADAAACNVNFITMDYFSSLPNGSKIADNPDFSRQAAAVWSWKTNDRGQNGDCAMFDGADGRWSSANCSLARRFACARPRSESSLDPLDWADPLGEDWKITSASGPWTEGANICRSEFPDYNFGVPVNGYQNRKLKGAHSSDADLWLNYSQRQVKGRWVIGRIASVNSPPVADAGADQVIECGSSVTLNGSGSSDSDGDALTYTWTGSFGTLTGKVVTTTLARGTHAVLLTVSDGKDGTDTDEVTITIRDTSAPSLSVTLTPSVLWAPNHRMVDIVANIQPSDGCDSEPLVELVSITSNEPEQGRGDGGVAPDILGAEMGTDDREFKLRAERTGDGTARVYTAKYRVTDASGNWSEATAQVIVPHDRSVARPPLPTHRERR
jgi:hypothetical protein